MAVFLIPFTIQAETITAPVYKVDVAQPAVGIGLSKFAAVAQSTEAIQRTQSVANIKLEPADLVNKVSQYNSHKSIDATGIIGVSGGDSTGIRPS